MSAALPEVIDHLSRHEGGALGCSHIWFHTPERVRRSRLSVDEFLTMLRAADRGDTVLNLAIGGGPGGDGDIGPG